MRSRLELSIICVDDEPGGLGICQSIIAQVSDVTRADFFSTPHEAIAFVSTHRVDIAFLDINLPEMTGFALADQLKRHCPTIKVAFITGNIDYMYKANRKVCAPYLFKPFFPEDMTKIIDQFKELL